MSQLSNPDPSGGGASFRRSTNYTFEWSLGSWWRAALFLIPIIAGSVWLARDTVRIARSAYEVDSHSIAAIQKALLKDPNNPDLSHRMGLIYTFDPAQINLPEGIKSLRMAANLNPRRWDFWSDLGTSCDFAGDTPCADEAFERALALNPSTTGLLWAVGNHYLLTDRQEKAFARFRQLLDSSPSYFDSTFRLCLRATRDPLTIYSAVVPNGKDPAARFAFLMFLSSTADYESAMKIWGQMISGPDRSPNMSLVKPFLNFLIDHNQIQDAGTVWNDLQRAGVIPPEPNSPSANLLYNGGFEGLPLNAGFDWRTVDSPDLVLNFADHSAHTGATCLRIDFILGRNAEYDLLDQVVRVAPNTPYHLTAYVRSGNLTSDSGPRLRVVEMGCANCEARTSDPTVGTTSWHPIDVSFMTQPQTQAVRVTFWRPQDQVSHRDIMGTVWLDDVALRPVGASAPDVNHERGR